MLDKDATETIVHQLLEPSGKTAVYSHQMGGDYRRTWPWLYRIQFFPPLVSTQ